MASTPQQTHTPTGAAASGVVASPRTVPGEITIEALDLLALQRLDVDDVLLFLPEAPGPLAGIAELVDWQACGALSAAIYAGRLQRGLWVRTLMPAPRGLLARRLLVTGLGPLQALNEGQMAAALAQGVAAARGAGGHSLVAALPALGAQPSRRQGLALELLLVRAAAALPAPGEVPLVRAKDR